MELIKIVDENGEFTGEVMDKEEAHDKNLLHNEVAAFVINDKGQVLLQKRSANKRFSPNKWGICAGHVDAYESLENAIIREIKEEIGIDINPNKLIPLKGKKVSIRKTNSHITYFYYIKLNLNEEDFIIQKEELSEVKWFDINEVIEMIKSKDEIVVFKDDILEFFYKLKALI